MRHEETQEERLARAERLLKGEAEKVSDAEVISVAFREARRRLDEAMAVKTSGESLTLQQADALLKAVDAKDELMTSRIMTAEWTSAEAQKAQLLTELRRRADETMKSLSSYDGPTLGDLARARDEFNERLTALEAQMKALIDRIDKIAP